MPRLVTANPKYRKHRASGQAVVTLDGLTHYLGPHGTKASHKEYDRLIAEWLASGRHSPVPRTGPTTAQLMIQYMHHAEKYYRKNGKLTSEVNYIRAALRPVRYLFERLPAAEFTPKKFKALQEHMIRQGLSRQGINARCNRVKRMIAWGRSEELIPRQGFARDIKAFLFPNDPKSQCEGVR